MIEGWGIAVGAAVLVIAVIWWWRVRGPDSHGSDDIADLTIDLLALPIVAVSDKPGIEFYSMPVQLRVLVIAPIGRSATLPSKQDLPATLKNLIPHFMDIVDSHKPIFRGWEGQPSVEGFKQSFFNNVSLPGNKGVGSHWSSITGRFSDGDSRYLIGMAFSADTSNPIGEVTVAHDAQWMDVLRIKH